MKYMGCKIGMLLISAATLSAFQKYDQFSVYAGAFDILRERHRTFELGMEYKFSPQWRSPFDFLEFRPLIGIMANMKMSTYLYGGINFDLCPTDFLVVAPGFAAGWYNQSEGKNLGYPLEFRTCLEVAWQCDDQSRLGLRFYHLSNAGLGSKNPGSESIVLLYDIPLKHRISLSKNEL